MAHVHEQGLVFRDVHPTRIHLSNGVIKFNLVGMPYNFKKLLKNESFSGHLNYSAPEILEHGSDHMLGPKVDIWSLGCCLYYLVTKRDPYDGANPGDIKNKIR
jgi:serine/threonine protein kinase